MKKREKSDERSKTNLEKKREFQENLEKKKRKIRVKKRMKKISKRDVFSWHLSYNAFDVETQFD